MTEKTIDTALEQVCDRLARAVERQQQDGDPAHEDFYTWGWALSELTQRTHDASRVLMRQVPRYGERRVLRDDEGGDPAVRLQEARAYLDQVAAALAQANVAARSYHSAIGHIAVEVDPEARP